MNKRPFLIMKKNNTSKVMWATSAPKIAKALLVYDVANGVVISGTATHMEISGILSRAIDIISKNMDIHIDKSISELLPV